MDVASWGEWQLLQRVSNVFCAALAGGACAAATTAATKTAANTPQQRKLPICRFLHWQLCNIPASPCKADSRKSKRFNFKAADLPLHYRISHGAEQGA
jgi:hypothetical protein